MSLVFRFSHAADVLRGERLAQLRFDARRKREHLGKTYYEEQDEVPPQKGNVIQETYYYKQSFYIHDDISIFCNTPLFLLHVQVLNWISCPFFD